MNLDKQASRLPGERPPRFKHNSLKRSNASNSKNERLLIRQERKSSESEEPIKRIAEADETIQLASYEILIKSETAMWTQANLLPEAALHLLR